MVMYRAGKDGMPNDFHLVHLGRFAMGGAGIVFTEATAIEPRARTTDSDCGLWNDAQMAASRRISAAIRSEGALAGIQLIHSGRKASMQRAYEGNGPLGPADFALGRDSWPVVGPSDLPVGPGWLVPQELTVPEIRDLVDTYTQAVRRADAAEFDVCEIHGAHGYLIASFLSPISNRRTDAYGGDRVGRMRFALEVARAARAAWPARKPLFFRVSSLDGGGGWDLEDTVVLAAALRDCGVDVVDCSAGGITALPSSSPIARYPGFQVPFAAEVRRRGGIQSMAVGLILDGPQAERILQDGAADLIAVGRQALYDPMWAFHAAEALGCDPDFAMWPTHFGYWLERRAKTLRQAAVA
jgi:2,4-dienoyl-CoA reductase-like NADH-dependent reductase (Old Yellow Enzyme family)